MPPIVTYCVVYPFKLVPPQFEARPKLLPMPYLSGCKAYELPYFVCISGPGPFLDCLNLAVVWSHSSAEKTCPRGVDEYVVLHVSDLMFHAFLEVNWYSPRRNTCWWFHCVNVMSGSLGHTQMNGEQITEFLNHSIEAWPDMCQDFYVCVISKCCVPDEWPCWRRRFEQFRNASGLSSDKDNVRQEKAKYDKVLEKFDNFFQDRLVVGIRDSSLSQRLQLDPELTLQNAQTIIRQKEAVKDQQETLKRSNLESGGLCLVQPRSGELAESTTRSTGRVPKDQSKQERCPNCGSNHYGRERCPARGVVCYRCKREDNFSVVCRSKRLERQEDLFMDTVGVLYGPGQQPLEVMGQFTSNMIYNGLQSEQVVFVMKELKKNLLGLLALTALQLVSREKLARMESLGVITKVEGPSEWCCAMVVVPKKDNTVHICVDLKPLNENVQRENFPLPKVDETLPQLAEATAFSKIDANSGFWQIPLAKESIFCQPLLHLLVATASLSYLSAFQALLSCFKDEWMEFSLVWMAYSVTWTMF
eukprot:Em0022g624a